MRIFKVNEITGELELDKEYIKLFLPFNEIYKRDKGGKVQGDYDGRNKLFAFREFALVWYVAANDSPAVEEGLSEDEAIIRAIELFQLGQDYKLDKTIKNAIEFWKQEWNLDTPSTKMLRSILRGFNLGSRLIEQGNKKLEKIIEDLEATDLINDLPGDEKVKDR